MQRYNFESTIFHFQISDVHYLGRTLSIQTINSDILERIIGINLIEKNKTLVESGQTPLFNEVISQKYVEFSQSFADWMTKVLPQLFLWKKKYFEKKKREEASPIENDYFTLYAEYEKFLDENNLYAYIY